MALIIRLFVIFFASLPPAWRRDDRVGAVLFPELSDLGSAGRRSGCAEYRARFGFIFVSASRCCRR